MIPSLPLTKAIKRKKKKRKSWAIVFNCNFFTFLLTSVSGGTSILLKLKQSRQTICRALSFFLLQLFLMFGLRSEAQQSLEIWQQSRELFPTETPPESCQEFMRLRTGQDLNMFWNKWHCIGGSDQLYSGGMKMESSRWRSGRIFIDFKKIIN